MDTNNDKGMAHLINDKGERKVVSWSERKKMNESESDNEDKFYIDLDWYNEEHGYISLEDARKRIEGEYYNRI